MADTAPRAADGVDPHRFKIVEERVETLWAERAVRVLLQGYVGTAFRLLWPVLIGLGAAAIARYTILDCVRAAGAAACQ